MEMGLPGDHHHRPLLEGLEVEDVGVVEELAHRVAAAEDDELAALDHAGGVPHARHGPVALHLHPPPGQHGRLHVQQPRVVVQAAVPAPAEEHHIPPVQGPYGVPEAPGGQGQVHGRLPRLATVAVRAVLAIRTMALASLRRRRQQQAVHLGRLQGDLGRQAGPQGLELLPPGVVPGQVEHVGVVQGLLAVVAAEDDDLGAHRAG
mmetsp:Transcript_22959/g.48589  ORF Transcript_22959/g.48589 Transcript_22959/m.48589 type:complete len:205 (-) Transcript_22959:410-1024(-)